MPMTELVCQTRVVAGPSGDLAVRSTGRVHEGIGLVLRPPGAVLMRRTPDQIRAYWIVLAGLHAAPHLQEKATRLGPYMRYRDELSRVWEPEYLEIATAFMHGREPLELAFAALVKDGRLVQSLGRDPLDQVSVLDTWPWSPVERTHFLRIVMESNEVPSDVDAKDHVHLRKPPVFGRLTPETLSRNPHVQAVRAFLEPAEDQTLAEGVLLRANAVRVFDKIATGPKWWLPYKATFGSTFAERADDPSVETETRWDAPVRASDLKIPVYSIETIEV